MKTLLYCERRNSGRLKQDKMILHSYTFIKERDEFDWTDIPFFNSFTLLPVRKMTDPPIPYPFSWLKYYWTSLISLFYEVNGVCLIENELYCKLGNSLTTEPTPISSFPR